MPAEGHEPSSQDGSSRSRGGRCIVGSDAGVGRDGSPLPTAPLFSANQGASHQLECERGGGPGSLKGEAKA